MPKNGYTSGKEYPEALVGRAGVPVTRAQEAYECAGRVHYFTVSTARCSVDVGRVFNGAEFVGLVFLARPVREPG